MSCVANTIWTVKVVRKMFLLAVLALLPQSPALAMQSVLLSWNPSQVPGVVGYKVYSGAASQSYTSVIDVGNATNVMIPALPDGSTNYFSATTYDALTNESVHSAEVVFVVPSATTLDTNSSVTNIVVNPTPPNPTPANVPSILNAVANLTVTTNPADASSMIVSWDASTDAGVAGYQVFYGTASGNYPNVTNLGLVNSLVVTGLVAGVTNFFAVREYDSAWNESPISTEVSYVLPTTSKQFPTLNAISDLSINMNTAAQTVLLTGITMGLPNTNRLIKITAKSSNTSVIATPKITYANLASVATLKFAPVANASGVVTITVTVNDGSASNNLVTQSFVVTVINTVRLAGLPKFTKQPTAATVQSGKQVSFSVAMAGKAPFRYQWMCNGTNLPGATSSTLTFKKANTNQAGVYSVFVSNTYGSTNSDLAQLSVLMPTNTSKVQATNQSIAKTTIATATTMTAIPAATLGNTTSMISTPVRINGQFSFQVTGLTGATYVVLATQDLKNWSPVQTNTAPFTYTEANAGGYTKRFYRALYQP